MAVLPRPPAGNLWVFDQDCLIRIAERQHPDAQERVVAVDCSKFVRNGAKLVR